MSKFFSDIKRIKKGKYRINQLCNQDMRILGSNWGKLYVRLRDSYINIKSCNIEILILPSTLAYYKKNTIKAQM